MSVWDRDYENKVAEVLKMHCIDDPRDWISFMQRGDSFCVVISNVELPWHGIVYLTEGQRQDLLTFLKGKS